MTDNTSLLIFKSIANFITDLAENFGKIHRPLQLYKRLIDKTKILHVKPIKKHIEKFKIFCISNRSGIQVKDFSKFTMDRISYSDRVFIDIKIIFQKANRQEREAIWKAYFNNQCLL